jgi:hypothetical protein
VNDNQKREAVAKLCTYAEGIIQRGKLPELDETNLRFFVNEACSAFDMVPCQDRLETELQIVRTEMERAP